jgi:PAS domain S-box-containing protein
MSRQDNDLLRQNELQRENEQLRSELNELRIRLSEAEDTLQAIREGEVDAIVVSGSHGEQVFSLTSSDQVYRRIVETMREAALTVSFEGLVLYCNRQFSDLVKAPQERIVGQHFLEFVAAEQQAEAESVLATSRTETTKRRLVFRRCDGTMVPAHLSATLLHSNDTDSICIVATDMRVLESSNELIQQLRMQQDALRESENRLQFATENSPDTMFIQDRDLRFLWVGRGAFPLSAEECVGRTDFDLQPLADATRLTEIKRSVMEEGLRRTLELPLEHRIIEATYQPWVDEAGMVIGLAGYEHDITEHKRLEESLRVAKEQAEEASRAKTDFLAHMSHEIRTPIGGIMGMIDILSSRIRDPEQQSYIALVKEAAHSLLTIIGDILDLSRIEAGQVAVDLTECELRQIVESIVVPMQLDASRKDIDLSLEIGESVPALVRIDREKVSQVLRNLITNALKYTHDGSVRVGVNRIDHAAKGGARLQFTVSDTGVGIPADKLDSIFDSFVRLRSSVTSATTDGTGLGLTITRKLVALLGGSLKVDSVPGEGSTFTFTVDVVPVEQLEQKRTTFDLSDLESLPPLRILLAEDNRINKVFMTTMLAEAGHRIVSVDTGRAAVDAVAQATNEGFDVVLMDVQMPIMDGIEATKRIRQLSGFASEVPIIALTAFAMKGDEDQFRAAGMNGYVTKPVSWSVLAKEIRNCC